MMSNLVSVVIPVFNRQAYIAQAVESVLAQTYKDFEVIVVDDGSTDRTKEIVHVLCAADSRVRYVWQQNSERSVARNTGISNAKGSYIGFLDSDDRWLPQKLELQVDLLDRNPAFVMALCWFETFDDQGEVLGSWETPSLQETVLPNFCCRLAEANRIGSPCPLVRRSIFGSAGMFAEEVGLTCFEDWEMWTRLACFGAVGIVPNILAQHRIHGGNTEKPVDASIYLAFISHLLHRIPLKQAKLVREVACHRYWEILRTCEGAGTAQRFSAILEGYSILKTKFLWNTLRHHSTDLCATIIRKPTARKIKRMGSSSRPRPIG